MDLTGAEQEFVCHLFAPLDGPKAESAYRQMLAVWRACREVLRTTERVPGLDVRHEPPPVAQFDHLPRFLAVQQDVRGDRQVIMRREHDVLNLSVAIARPRGEREAAPRPIGWAQAAQVWSQISLGETDRLLAEVRLYLVKAPLPSISEGPHVRAEFGEALEPFLPYREHRTPGLWAGGQELNGCLVWELGPAAGQDRCREFVIAAEPDDDPELSAWTWSDGRPDLPPFARYLMHAAKLRHHARLMAAWHDSPRSTAPADLLAQLEALFGGSQDVAALTGLLGRLSVEETFLLRLRGELKELRVSCLQARDNLRRSAPDTSPLPVDDELAEWLVAQASDDLDYLEADFERVQRGRALTQEALTTSRLEPDEGTHLGPDSVPVPGGMPRPPDGAAAEDPNLDTKVFVVHGRDAELNRQFFDLLRAIGLHPLEWETLVAATSNAAPHAVEVLREAPRLARAAVVLLTPDDVTSPHPDVPADDAVAGDGVGLQPDAWVLFQFGLAMSAFPNRTVVVTVGRQRTARGFGGLQTVRLAPAAESFQTLAGRLSTAGCRTNTSGTDWLDPGRFRGLMAFDRRDPRT